ncbi:MAG: 2-hydroxyhepta-2,4-diene-1,7-dioate isomerase [Halobacteriovoraceae bacterium]|nr:2-hydroxyhepta-2,4-diene-1,7-dioate isomerase [Halobacteriovoraceae bacterium]
MKICSYKLQTPIGSHTRLGILLGEKEIVDVNLVWQKSFEDKNYFNAQASAWHKAPSSLADVLNIYQENALSFFQETLELFNKYSHQGSLKTRNNGELKQNLEGPVSLAKPLDRINCYRDFYAHEKHVAAGFKKRKEPIPEAWYEIPAYYKGATSGFIGPNETVPWPSYTKVLDYELEFGLVIGRDGKNIKAEKALEHVFGYTVFNDISARDIQKKEMAVRLGPAKGKDFCSVIGPVILTADEFSGSEPHLKMTAHINGEKWSEGYSGDSHYSWAQMIEHASREEWLRATDFMGSGTVGTGCGLEIDRWIQPGDQLKLEIEKIGILENTIGSPNSRE